MLPSINVLGSPLKTCSHKPLTGWFRDGRCNTDKTDRGLHTVAAVVTDDFLACLKELGNDLVTPAPMRGFRLRGDRAREQLVNRLRSTGLLARVLATSRERGGRSSMLPCVL